MEKKNTAPVKVKSSAATSASASKASISDPSKQFTNLKGAAAAMKIQNIDTDMIIPKQFLKTIKRSGLGVSAFYELRYDPSTGNERPDFILNKEGYRALQSEDSRLPAAHHERWVQHSSIHQPEGFYHRQDP
jgi:3-isopropylmalate dehydratase